MYRYGDDKMSFSDAVLILKIRGYEEELDRHIAPDIALAIKTIIKFTEHYKIIETRDNTFVVEELK